MQIHVANVATASCGVCESDLRIQVSTCCELICRNITIEMNRTIKINLTTIVVNDLARLYDQVNITFSKRIYAQKNLTSWTPDSKTPKVDGYVIC